MADVTVWYLESTAPEEVIAAPNPGAVEVQEARVKQFEFNRFLYQFIGEQWQWTDKLVWDDEQWRAYAEADTLRTWVAWCEGAPAGYFELHRSAEAVVELCYFGLARKFIGRGIGGYLLTEALRAAWSWSAARVQVNTCSKDHPSALANYQARGMRIYRTETV